MRPERMLGVKLYALCLTSCLLHVTFWFLVVTFRYLLGSFFELIVNFHSLRAPFCLFLVTLSLLLNTFRLLLVTFFSLFLTFCSLLISFWSQLHRVQKDTSPPSIHNPPCMAIPLLLYFWKAVLTHPFYRQHCLYGIFPLPPFYKKILTFPFL